MVTLNGAQLSAFQVVLIFTSSIHDLIAYNMTAVEEVPIYEIIQFPSYTKRHDKLAVVVAFVYREARRSCYMRFSLALLFSLTFFL